VFWRDGEPVGVLWAVEAHKGYATEKGYQNQMYFSNDGESW
jgi:hypothetical protein